MYGTGRGLRDIVGGCGFKSPLTRPSETVCIWSDEMVSKYKICLGIMTHNEIGEFTQLMNLIFPHRHLFHQVVIVDDFSRPEMQELFGKYDLSVYKRVLNGDFSAQRNYLLEHLDGDVAFILDPDECPGEKLLKQLPLIADRMMTKNIDAISVPRLNIHYETEDLPDFHTVYLDQHMLDTQSPDRQTRIIRLNGGARYINKVHERLVGINILGMLPNKIEYSIIHVKSIKRQKDQDKLYSKIGRFAPNEIGKKLGLKRVAQWLGLLGSFQEVDLDLPQ